MDSDATFAMLVNTCGAGWVALATYRLPLAWRDAWEGSLAPAARSAAITAQCLLAIAMLTSAIGRSTGKGSTAVTFEPSSMHELPVRFGVLAALTLLLAALLLTLGVGIRSRTTQKEFIA